MFPEVKLNQARHDPAGLDEWCVGLSKAVRRSDFPLKVDSEALQAGRG